MMVSIVALCLTLGQTPPPPSSPVTEAPPVWSRIVKMPDGRTFVSDGALLIDAAVVRVTTLPSTVLPPETGKTMASRMAVPHAREVGLRDLTTGSRKNTYTAPGDIALNGNYVSLLRRAAPGVRLRLQDDRRAPVVLVLDGKPVGLVMPLSPGAQ